MAVRGTRIIHLALATLDARYFWRYFYRGWHARVATEMAKRVHGVGLEGWIPAEIPSPISAKVSGVLLRAFPAQRGNPFSYLAMMRELSKIRRSESVLVHIHDGRSITAWYLMPLIPPAPVVLQNHGFLYPNLENSPAEPFVFRRASRIYVLTREAKSYLSRIGLPAERIRVQTMGVDSALFRPLDKRRSRLALGLPTDTHIILYVGQFIPLKGLHVVMRAVEELRRKLSIELVAVGGTSAEPLYDKVSKMTRYVFGWTSSEKMPLFYSAADATCSYLTSDQILSASGPLMPIVESLACGTPVVSNTLAHIPGNSERADAGEAVTNEAEFTERLALLLARGRSAVRCREAVLKHFDWDTIIHSTLADYRAISAT